MSTVAISALTTATAANLTGTAIAPVTDNTTTTVGATFAQLRTVLLAQGTGYATTDVFNLGTGGLGDSAANLVLKVSGAASVATLTMQQVTARIVGGSTNGLAIRNSANTRDNFQITDAGTAAILSNGTNSAGLYTSALSGERVAGGVLQGTTGGVSLGSNVNGTAGLLAQIVYFDQTIWRSAVEVANSAAFPGTLSLMKSGGDVVTGISGAGGTTDTSGYVYITTCSGTPTGVPGNASAGRTAIRYDSSAHKLWVFDQPAAAWKGILVA